MTRANVGRARGTRGFPIVALEAPLGEQSGTPGYPGHEAADQHKLLPVDGALGDPGFTDDEEAW